MPSCVKTLLFILLNSLAACAASPKGPTQPHTAAPGGWDYPYKGVHIEGPYGEGARRFWLYEPEGPQPVSAPVVVFMHGYGAVDAKAYGGWIGHLVRRGNIVIYPQYQSTLFGPATYTDSALAAIKEALHVLRTEPGHVRPDRQGNFAVVGHSLGCPISSNIIGRAADEGLPRVKAFMACNPCDLHAIVKVLPSVLQSPAHMPDLLMLVVVGASDHVAGKTTGRQLFTQSTGVKPEHKNLITLCSDRAGWPWLSASHFAPLAAAEYFETGARLGIGLDGSELPAAICSPLTSKIRIPMSLPATGGMDALDFFGYWKWFDALTDAAFYGTHREFALGNTPEQKYMGEWSDGTPVKTPLVELAK